MKALGVSGKQFPSSIEALLRRAMKGGEPFRINPLVDLYNVISLRHRLPCGGEDLDTIEGEIRLTRAAGDEHFVPLGGSESEPPPAGAVIYRDDLGVICSCWNWREVRGRVKTLSKRWPGLRRPTTRTPPSAWPWIVSSFPRPAWMSKF